MESSTTNESKQLWVETRPDVGQPKWDANGYVHDPVESKDFAAGEQQYGFDDYESIESRMAFTGAEVNVLTEWVIIHGNQMEQIAWLYACASVASGYRATGIELGEDYGDEKFDARYRKARTRLRDKLLEEFAGESLLVAVIKELLPIHEKKRKPKP